MRDFEAPGALAPLGVSLASGAVALVVIVCIGTPLGYLLAHARGVGARVAETGLLVMLLMPPLVVGLLLVFMIGPLTPVGSFLAHLHLSATNTFLALIIAEVYEAVPYYVLGVASGFESIDSRMEEQGALLGDSPMRTFFKVSLPLAAPQLATSLAISWARAIGAFGAVIIIAYHPYGLPMQIWTTLNETGLASALPFAACLVVVALPFPLIAYSYGRYARR
ncbi:MAG: ABC transporter permease subunit [Ferrimicrobium sp.]